MDPAAVEVLVFVVLVLAFVVLVVAAVPVVRETVYFVVVSLTLVPMNGSVPAWRTVR